MNDLGLCRRKRRQLRWAGVCANIELMARTRARGRQLRCLVNLGLCRRKRRQLRRARVHAKIKLMARIWARGRPHRCLVNMVDRVNLFRAHLSQLQGVWSTLSKICKGVCCLAGTRIKRMIKVIQIWLIRRLFMIKHVHASIIRHDEKWITNQQKFLI